MQLQTLGVEQDHLSKRRSAAQEHALCLQCDDGFVIQMTRRCPAASSVLRTQQSPRATVRTRSLAPRHQSLEVAVLPKRQWNGVRRAISHVWHPLTAAAAIHERPDPPVIERSPPARDARRSAPAEVRHKTP